MQMMDDMELVQEYATRNSEPAFATLVERHINLVYCVALRQVGNPHQAEEITQAVFIILARKAANLRRGTILAGWLFQTVRLTAANFRRTEIRRAQREQEAYMQSNLQEAETDSVWQQIGPMLDAAIADLGEKDRNAILLRFVEGKELREVGVALGATEAATQRRVSRAVEKMRTFFTKRGIVISGTALAAAMVANSATGAPVGLASSITVVAVIKGTAASAPTLALIKGTLKLMAWTKVKFAIGIGAAVLLTTGGVTIGLLHAEQAGIPGEEITKKVQEKYASLTSYSDTGSIQTELNGKTLPTSTFSLHMGRPNYYRVEWDNNNLKGAVWSAGDGDFLQIRSGKYYRMKDSSRAFATATGVSGGATVVPQIFFKESRGQAALFSSKTQVTREKDEKIGSVDCYVVSCLMGQNPQSPIKVAGMSITLWVGKKDFLIHQMRQTIKSMEAGSIANTQVPAVQNYSSTATHENIVVNETMTKKDFVHELPAGTELSEKFP